MSDIEEDDDGCAITTEFVTTSDPNWMRQFPEPLKLEMTLRLQGASLKQTFKITHLGQKAAPFGLGLHTWFLINGEPDRWNLNLPVSGLVEADDELVPTGEMAPLGEFQSLNEGTNLRGANYDTILSIGDHPVEAVLTRDDGYGLRYSADPQYFKYWVIYTKGEADQFLCIEPYTWLPNAPNLQLPADTTGLIELQPKETLELNVNLDIFYPDGSPA